MNKPNTWEELEAQSIRENFEKSKSSSILYIREKNKQNWEICLSHWEKLLSSDYWRNWQQKIRECQNNDELDFYVKRLSALIEFIRENTIKGRVNQPDLEMNIVSRLVCQEEKRLEKISSEDFKKEDKFADVKWKELSAKECLNDPWFNKQINILFGLENEKLTSDYNDNYQDWTKDQLITEISNLKSEIETLKNNKFLTSSEKQERLQKNRQKLEKLQQSYNFDSQPNNSKLSTNLAIGGTLLAIIGLFSFLVIRKTKIKEQN